MAITREESFYLRGLNGIRAIAVIAVLFNHINQALLHFNIYNFSLFGFRNHKPNGWTLGEQGVTMFFVLSGFLITYLLLLEIAKKSKLNVKAFYVRRILRIWPLYFFFLFISIAILYFSQGFIPSGKSLFFYVFLMANIPFIFKFLIPVYAHLWSIAVEEQFYLFWPLFFKFKSKLKNILIIFIAGQILLRFSIWFVFPHSTLSSFVTVNRFDCMMFGGLLAVLLHQDHGSMKIITSKYTQIFSWCIILVHFFNREVFNAIISMELITLATGFIICGQIKSKHKIINLENKVCNYLGKYSYGIYVFHPLIIYLFYHYNILSFINNEGLYIAFIFIGIIVSTLIVAYLSYNYFEVRFLRLKSKYSVVHSTNISKEIKPVLIG